MLVTYIILISFINKLLFFYNHYACIGKGGGLLWLETDDRAK